MADNNIVPISTRRVVDSTKDEHIAKVEKHTGMTSLKSAIGGFAGGSRQSFAQSMRNVPERTPKPELPEYRVPPPPASNVKTWICERCGFTVDDQGNHGYFKDVNGKAVPCSLCAPISKRAMWKRRTDKYIRELVKEFKFLNFQNLPQEASTLSMADYPRAGDNKAKKKVQQFIDGNIINMFLTGDVGRGKTGLAIATVRELAKQDVQVLFLNAKQYFSLLQDNFGDAPDNHIKDIVKGVEVLVLDDLGTERVTDSGFTVEETQEIIEARHAAGLRTLITSNFSLDGLAGYWYMPRYERAGFQSGRRLCSRMQGWYQVVVFSGPDLRLV